MGEREYFEGLEEGGHDAAAGGLLVDQLHLLQEGLGQVSLGPVELFHLQGVLLDLASLEDEGVAVFAEGVAHVYVMRSREDDMNIIITN